MLSWLSCIFSIRPSAGLTTSVKLLLAGNRSGSLKNMRRLMVIKIPTYRYGVKKAINAVSAKEPSIQYSDPLASTYNPSFEQIVDPNYHIEEFWEQLKHQVRDY